MKFRPPQRKALKLLIEGAKLEHIKKSYYVRFDCFNSVTIEPLIDAGYILDGEITNAGRKALETR